MEKRKMRSVLWDVLLTAVFTALFSLAMPFVCVAGVLAVVLDLHSRRWAATVTLGVVGLLVSGFFYGSLGLVAAGIVLICAVGIQLLVRFRVNHMDGLLYALIGAELLCVAAVFFLTRNLGDLAGLLVEDFKTVMVGNPDVYRGNLALFAVAAQEGISADLNQQVAAYMAMDFSELLRIAEPVLLNTVTLLLPCVVFIFGLLSGAVAWIAGGYALRNGAGGEKHPSAPCVFWGWTLPRPLLMVILLVYLVTLILPANSSDAVTIGMTLAHVFSWIVFWFQGETALAFFLDRRHVRMGGRWAWSIALTLLLPGGLFFFGLFDAVFKMRENLIRGEKLAQEMLKKAQAEAEARHAREGNIPSPYATPPEDGQDNEHEDDNEKGDS